MARIRLMPLTIDVVAGAVDGVIVASDMRATPARTTFTKGFETWYRGALVLGGLAAGVMGAHEDVYEPLLGSGLTLLASDVSRRGMLNQAQSSTAAAHELAAAAYGRLPVHAASRVGAQYWTGVHGGGVQNTGYAG